MHLNTNELTRLLEYVPKETAPDLHKKILGQLISERHYEALFSATRGERPMAEEKFLKGLTQKEIDAWKEFNEGLTNEGECSA